MRKATLARLSSIVLLMTLLWPAMATDFNNALDFSLTLQNQTQMFRYESQTRTVNTQIMELAWQEQLASYLTGSVRLGYLTESQPQHPTPELISCAGQYLGIKLRSPLQLTTTQNVYLGFEYIYAASQNVNAPTFNRNWNRTELGIGWHWQALPQVGLQVSQHYQHQAGIDSTSSTAFPFSMTEGSFYSAQLLLAIDKGQINLSGFYGGLTGGSIEFQHRF